jgi:hypothetical protein
MTIKRLGEMTVSIEELLQEVGISDAEAYLEKHKDAKIYRAGQPYLEQRGSIPLMLDRIILKDEVCQRLAKLKRT